jgi:hypothetical protein
MGSLVGLVEINEIFPVPLSELSAKDKSSPVGFTSPIGFSTRLNSIRLAEDVLNCGA